MSADVELSRIRQLARTRPFSSPAAVGSRAFQGRVTTASPVAGTFVNVIPQVITGTEAEGGAVTVTDAGSDPILVYVAGSVAPANGDQKFVRWVNDRWEMKGRRKTGGTTYPCAGCSAIPSTLYGTLKYEPGGTIVQCLGPGAILYNECVSTGIATTLTYTLTLTTGTITVIIGSGALAGTYTATTWWDSGAVAAPSDDVGVMCPPYNDASGATANCLGGTIPSPTYPYKRAVAIPIVSGGTCYMTYWWDIFQSSASAIAQSTWSGSGTQTGGVLTVSGCSPFASSVTKFGTTYYLTQ